MTEELTPVGGLPLAPAPPGGTTVLPLRQDHPASAAGAPGLAPKAARPPRILVLDGLRLVAAVSVLGFHYLAGAETVPWQRTSTELFPRLHRLAGFGWLGVVFFFMISGFVICMSSWGKSLQKFWQSRVLRLFPLYWAAVVIGTLANRYGPHPPGEQRITLSQMLTNLTMLHEPLGVRHVDTVSWTLWIELRFYIIFSVVVLLGTNVRRVSTFCWCWALAGVFVPKAGIPLLDTLLFPDWAPFFIAGVAFFLLRKEGRITGETLGILVLSWLLVQQHLPAVMAAEGHGIDWKACLTAITAMYGLMFLVALGKLDRIQWRWLPVAGAISYPLYLIHQSVGVRLIWRWNERLGAWTTLVSVTTAMLLAAWLLYRFVEKPLTPHLRRLVARSLPNPRLPSPTSPLTR
ncbi:acyltransferase family protein [Kitasatospora sp. NPDC091335]|uniref:acyltransferase family protein n=1 Tax=Kitasatospora sp. NPDC091335 TaxID=3364085 RepID=UPI00380FC38F